MIEHLLLGHVLDILRRLPSDFVDLCVTSPPYYKQRKYGAEFDWDGWYGELGQEPIYEMYISNLMLIFTEIKRILKKTGSLYVNISDSYNNRKSLIGIPDRFKTTMVDDKWICRNELIWHRPNQMPEPVKDRFTVDFEKMYFFTKSKKYYFVKQYEPYDKPLNRRGGDNMTGNDSSWDAATGQHRNIKRDVRPDKRGRNKRCVWSINTKPSKNTNFAVFPDDLIITPVLASSPVGGIVLDPFVGSGTTCAVSKFLNRGFIGIDADSSCIKMSYKAIYGDEFSMNW